MTGKDPILVHAAVFSAPFGCLWAAATDDGLLALEIEKADTADPEQIVRWVRTLDPSLEFDIECQPSAFLNRVGIIVQSYFNRRQPIPSMPLDLRLGTHFQCDVWHALCQIPHGETRSYQQIAAGIGRPKAARAVGQACGRNPIAIVVPCHRVITSSGGLGGFGSGLGIKRYLLDLEQRPRLS